MTTARSAGRRDSILVCERSTGWRVVMPAGDRRWGGRRRRWVSPKAAGILPVNVSAFGTTGATSSSRFSTAPSPGWPPSSVWSRANPAHNRGAQLRWACGLGLVSASSYLLTMGGGT